MGLTIRVLVTAEELEVFKGACPKGESLSAYCRERLGLPEWVARNKNHLEG